MSTEEMAGKLAAQAGTLMMNGAELSADICRCCADEVRAGQIAAATARYDKFLAQKWPGSPGIQQTLAEMQALL